MSIERAPRKAGRESVADSSLLHSVQEARRLLGGMGSTWFYAEVRAGRLRTIKLGTRTLVPHAELERYVREALSGVGK